MTFSKFKRTLRNAGWSCFFDSDGDAIISRGRARIVVWFDDSNYDEGYFYIGDNFIDVEDVSYIHFFPGGTVFWLYQDDSYNVYY